MPWKTDTEAYLCFYSSCPRLVFHRLEKVFYTFILTREQNKINSIRFQSSRLKVNTSSSAQLFSQAFEINIIPSHSNQPSSFPLELIDRFLYEAKIDFKLTKIQLCKAKMSVMRIGSRTPATSKMEFFAAIIKKQKLLNTALKSSILDVTMDTKN